MKAVFDIRPVLKYDSDICTRFRFQGRSRYFEVAQGCLNDWIVLRETKAGDGSGAYIAIAFATSLHRHPNLQGYYSFTFSNYLPFIKPVGMKAKGRYAETSLLEVRRAVQIGSVLQGNAMRTLYPADFEYIVRIGFELSSEGSMLSEAELSTAPSTRLEPEIDEFAWGAPCIESVLRSRLFRDEIFRKHVGHAYNFRCAVTRTRNADGNGRYEVQGAHVWSKSDFGPDIVQNGLAFAGSAHWLFDNYVFTINPNFTLRIAPGLIDPAYLTLFALPGERIHLPEDERLWPHAKFLDHHRAEFQRRHG